MTIPSIVLNVEEIGSRRLPAVNLLTFRVEKGFRMGGTKKVAVRLDLHNALNSNTMIENTPRSGPEFLQPRAIIGPAWRVVRNIRSEPPRTSDTEGTLPNGRVPFFFSQTVSVTFATLNPEIMQARLSMLTCGRPTSQIRQRSKTWTG